MRKTREFLALAVIALSACDNGGPNPSPPPAIIAPPVITMSSNPRTPLAATLSLSTDVPITSITLHVSDGVDAWDIDYRVDGTEQVLPVRGLHAGKAHTFSVTIGGATGTTSVPLNEVLTPPSLPTDFPVLDVTLHDGTRLEPGFTLFVPMSSNPYVIAIDTFGEVAWFLALDQAWAVELRLLMNGNLIFLQQECRIIEIDLEGDVVNAWDTRLTGTRACTDEIPGSMSLAIETAHHEIFEMPSGNLLTLSHGDVTVADYPNSDQTDAGTSAQTIIEDVIVEFSPDGTIVRELHVADILDPTRIGYDSVGNANDWTHGNGIIYDDRDDSYIFSARHQDAIFKFARDTGELRWILGTPGGWVEPWFSRVLIPTNFSSSDYSWHQHAPQITPDGTIMLFDNGNYRARPYQPKLAPTQNYSRAVEYAVDDATMEVTQLWEYGSPATSVDQDYAPFLGDADVLPETGNVLITFGGITRNTDTGLATDQLAQVARNARIVQVTHDMLPEKLMEIYCGTPDFTDEQDCIVYRADQIDSLVPRFQ